MTIQGALTLAAIVGVMAGIVVPVRRGTPQTSPLWVSLFAGAIAGAVASLIACLALQVTAWLLILPAALMGAAVWIWTTKVLRGGSEHAAG